MALKIIKTKKDYKAALDCVNLLFDRKVSKTVRKAKSCKSLYC